MTWVRLARTHQIQKGPSPLKGPPFPRLPYNVASKTFYKKKIC